MPLTSCEKCAAFGVFLCPNSKKKEVKLSPTDLRSCSSRKRIQKRDQRESDSFCQSTGKIRSTSAAPLVAIQKMREREAHTPTHGKASEKEAKATQKSLAKS